MIRIATEQDIPVIHRLAHETWWPAYESILSAEQISFMLEKMYAEDSLKKQMQEGNTFLIAEDEGQAVAFASFSCTQPEERVFKLHKIYIHPSVQGKGLGSSLISFIEKIVREEGGRVFELNVNRSNPAFAFYKKEGFKVYREADIPFYQFYMNDYIMRKQL